MLLGSERNAVLNEMRDSADMDDRVNLPDYVTTMKRDNIGRS